jgi:hypothetical protein
MCGSVKPLPAALIRAAYDPFESCFSYRNIKREANASLLIFDTSAHNGLGKYQITGRNTHIAIC